MGYKYRIVINYPVDSSDANTTPKSLKVKDKEIYYVQSERDPKVRYRVNFEDGTCTCSDFVHRGEVCKHFYKIVMERAIV